MLTLSRSFMRVDLERVSEARLDGLANSAFDAGEIAAVEFLALRQPGVRVSVSQGSDLQTIVIIGVGATWLFNAISKYEDFSKGLHSLIRDAKRAGSFVLRTLRREPELAEGRVESTRITTGHLTKLNRLLSQVRHDDLTRSDGVAQAIRLVERSGDDVTPEIREQLTELFEGVQVVPLLRRPQPTRPKGMGAQVDYSQPVPRPSRRRGVEMWRNPGEETKRTKRF